MPIGLIFWVLMLLWLVLGIFNNRAEFVAGNYAGFGGTLLQFILFFLLGWRAFGFMIQG